MLKKYQELNYSLTVKNQELLEQVAALKQEINKLNQRLLTERQLVLMLRHRYCRFLGEISKCCNNAMREISQPLDMLREIINDPEQEASPNKSISRRSMRLVQLTIRQIGTDENEKENRDPSVETYREDKTSYVQVRRRQPSASMPENTETPKSLEVIAPDTQTSFEESEVSNVLQMLPTPESYEQPEEIIIPESIQELEPVNLCTIREENTMDLSKSRTRAGLSGTKSIIDDSSIESITIAPARQEQHTNILSSSLRPPLARVSTTSRREKSHFNSNVMIVEDTLCANFRSTQVTSSTPYKTKERQQLKECYVKVKRIAANDLHIITSADVNTKDVTSNSENEVTVMPPKRRKFTFVNIHRPRFLNNTEDTLSDSFRTAHVVSSTPFKPPAPVIKKCYVKLKKMTPRDVRNRIRGSNRDEDSVSSSSLHTVNSTGSRPKRRAAPKNLQEPSIASKLRRDT